MNLLKNKKVVVFVFGCIFFVVAIIVFINISKNIRYNQGLEWFNSGYYEDAANVFNKLGNHKDSVSMRTEAEYRQAIKLKESEDFNNAIILFEKLGKYKDSVNMLRETTYQLALFYIESGDYENAYEQLQGLGDYKEAKLYLSKYKYVLKEKQYTDFNAKKTITKYEYDDAGKLIEEVNDVEFTTYEYNSLGQLSKKFNEEATYYYNSKGNIVKEIHNDVIYEKIYDDRGREKETYSYNANGEITYRVTYQYFDDNSEKYDAIETGAFYDFDGEVSEAWVAKLWYDRYGNVEIQEREVLSYGELMSRTRFENKYVYDSNGNWLEHSEYANGVLNMKRTQEFDKGGNIVKQASYNKEGSLISQTIYLYENIYIK